MGGCAVAVWVGREGGQRLLSRRGGWAAVRLGCPDPAMAAAPAVAAAVCPASPQHCPPCPPAWLAAACLWLREPCWHVSHLPLAPSLLSARVLRWLPDSIERVFYFNVISLMLSVLDEVVEGMSVNFAGVREEWRGLGWGWEQVAA